MRIVKLEKGFDIKDVVKKIKRSAGDYDEYEQTVKEIIGSVQERGDEALFEYTEKFDKARLTGANVRVTGDEIEDAYKKVDKDLIDVIRKALKNITEYHELQKRNTWITTKPDGSILGQRISSIEYAGVYVPGGKAAYPSTVLMNVTPAKVAGVENIIMCTPCNQEGEVYPTTLVAAHEAGVNEIYKVGGAQAIAAMAYGTESIPKVDKIVGPGNIFVALAKRLCYGHVSIDSIAGPSEILVLTDGSGDPSYAAADLLSQAEHDELASSVMVTDDPLFAEKVSEWTDKYTASLERKDIIQKSLDNFGYIFVTQSMDEAIELANAIAPEHMEILTANPFDTMTKIKNAGAMFLGEYSSEPLGDYFAGPNHVLPTNGTARFFSPLSVDDFIKKSSIIAYSEEGLRKVYKDVMTFANAEGLTAHANSMKVRFE